MRNKKEKRKKFLEYCSRVWYYLEAEMMVGSPKKVVDEEDIGFYYEAGNDVQTAAFLIKEILD